MSCYLGFQPTDKPNYFFVSYNSEDVDRVGPIAQRLFHGNVPLWYDFGLEYGEKWETQISGRIKDCQALILFFTKGILTKSLSYVRKEYEMATKYFGRKVYVVMLDKIENSDVPFDKVPWWIDVQEHQSIFAAGVRDLDVVVSQIRKAIGMESHEDRMNLLIRNYKALHDEGRHGDAERYLAEYLHGNALSDRGRLLAGIVEGNVQTMVLQPVGKTVTGCLESPLRNHTGEQVSSFFECVQLTLQGHCFTFGNSFMFHRGSRGDAHVINIWRNGENICTVGGLIEASQMQVYYDTAADTVYICYCADQEEMRDGELYEQSFRNVIILEDPQDTAVCTDLRRLVPHRWG